MKRNKDGGFFSIGLLVILVVAVVAVAAFFVLRSKDSDKNNSSQTTGNKSGNDDGEDSISLYNLGIASMDEVNITTDATRDFTKSGHKGFYIFGDILPGTPVRHNPNFEFASMKEGAELISAIDGIVGFIREQPESGDSEVFLMTKENSQWVIGYDHVTDLKVQKGDKVKVGDLIGYPARQGNGLLRFEFQVNKDDGSQDGMHICPVTLLDDSVISSWSQQLNDSQEKWEEISGLELYDTSVQDPAGCLEKEMTPAYAQGN